MHHEIDNLGPIGEEISSFMKHSREIIVPPDAQKADRAVELALVWASGGRQHVSLCAEIVDIWPDPVAWGLMLVDLARHATRAYVEDKGYDARQVLARIKEGVDAEWEKPDVTRNGNTHLVSGKNKRELTIPVEVEHDAQAFELIRLWETDDGQQVTLCGTLWKDPMPWGYLLVDLAQHVAKGYSKANVPPIARVLARIKEGLDVDWEEPDATQGRLV